MLVSVVVVFVLERFGASLRRALRAAAVREHELALARLPLEETVAERTTQLSAEVRAGQEREAQLAQTLDELRASRTLVRALSAPIIPVLPGVLVAPIVGSLDDDQARDLTTNVLRASSSTFYGTVERGGAAKLNQRCRNRLLYAHVRANLSRGVMSQKNGHAADDDERPGSVIAAPSAAGATVCNNQVLDRRARWCGGAFPARGRRGGDRPGSASGTRSASRS